MPDNTIKGIEQGRAAIAFSFATEGLHTQQSSILINRQNHYFKSTNYKSYVKKIPMMIKTNGIGATLAFIFSKKAKLNNNVVTGQQANPKNAYDLIYEQLTNYLRHENRKYLINNNTTSELVQISTVLASNSYRALTVEVLALFSWLKRLAEGLIQGEEEGGL